MNKRMVVLAEIIFEGIYEDSWDFVFKDKPDIATSVMKDIIEERLGAEAKVKIKKFRMEKIKK